MRVVPAGSIGRLVTFGRTDGGPGPASLDAWWRAAYIPPVDPNHLHLHVRDPERSRAFYEGHFGFRLDRRHDDILFLANEDGFDLALAPDPDPATLPPWFHFGFRLPTADAVKTLHAALGDAAAKLRDWDDLVTFRCRDPDGYLIEVYWEP